MKKIITARDILKKKGYLDRKFDSNGFLADIGGYYMEHGLDYPLSLIESTVHNDVGYKTDFSWNEEENRPAGMIYYNKYGNLIDYDNDPFRWCHVLVDPMFFDAALKLLRSIGGYKLIKEKYRFKVDSNFCLKYDFYLIKLL